ncbi:transposase [Streptomyces sp. NPDC004296]|uniref:transposase n=1 Tax=Streptomyces sp. NPDC004296 TaxID=3364697 RepID=UPI003694E739
MTGDGRTVTQLRVPDKTNEITCFAALLAPFDLTGVTVTADALHTQRAHARLLVDEKKAHYLLVVKANQPELHRRLRSLPWNFKVAGGVPGRPLLVDHVPMLRFLPRRWNLEGHRQFARRTCTAHRRDVLALVQ